MSRSACGCGRGEGQVVTQGRRVVKASINPMHLVSLMNRAPRCHARSKRSGRRCRAPAVRGAEVCRMHGARAGAPEGERNGRYVHGQGSGAVLAERMIARLLLRLAKAEIEGL